VRAAEVYRAWQGRVDEAGLSHYRRHHCGYLVGLGFPPSWTGGSMVVGLRHDSDLVLRPGMVFHLLSWLMGAGRGDYFVSNTAVLTDEGCEVLTKAPRASQVA
jgi:Xaa-Pro dipeptidase